MHKQNSYAEHYTDTAVLSVQLVVSCSNDWTERQTISATW